MCFEINISFCLFIIIKLLKKHLNENILELLEYVNQDSVNSIENHWIHFRYRKLMFIYSLPKKKCSIYLFTLFSNFSLASSLGTFNLFRLFLFISFKFYLFNIHLHLYLFLFIYFHFFISTSFFLLLFTSIHFYLSLLISVYF